MKRMDEFSGVDYLVTPELEEVGFAAGTVKGVRSFKVDKLGRLTGIHFAQVWKPGENKAECKQRGDYSLRLASIYQQTVNRLSYYPTYTFSTGTDYFEPETDPKEPHPMNGCKHGFYAYYDGSDDYHEEGYVSAVVEGYGETVIGTRGFRCMKARIVALNIPADVPQHLAKLVRRNYPDVPMFDEFDRMVSEFPPDNAGQYEAPSPDTDPDFWTRSA